MTDHAASIDKYIRGEMTPAEMADFEKLLETDAALRDDVAFQQMAFEALQDKEAFAFHQRLQNVQQTPKASSFPRWGWLLLLGLPLLGLLWWLQPTQIPPITPDPKENIPSKDTTTTPASDNKPVLTVEKPAPRYLALADKYYTENLSSELPGTRSRSGNNTPVEPDSLSTAFASKNYAAIIKLAKSKRPGQNDYNTLTWAGAHAAYLSHYYEQCIDFCTIIYKVDPSSRRAQEAELLMMLAYIKNEKTTDPAFMALVEKARNNRLHLAHEMTEQMK